MRNSRSWLPGAVLAAGTVSVALLLGTDIVRQRAALADMARIGAVAEIEVASAVTHLWLEEYVSGDRVDLPAIDRRLEHSLSLARAMQGSAEVASPTPVRRLETPELRRQAAELERWLETFRAISDERLAGYKSGLVVGIGSPIDASYDDVFAEVFAQTKSLSAALRARLMRGQKRSHTVFLVVIGAWSGLMMVAAAGLWTRERRRRRVEDKLQRSQEQLLQSQKMDAVGRLAGGLAHDLNNYLAAIRGHCELVRIRRPEGDALVAKMDRTISIVNKAASMIARLQTFSHRQPPQYAVVGLGAVIESMTTLIGPTLGDNIRLRTSLPEDLWMVSADRTQLEQLIVNLLVNAREAMPEGGEILIHASNQEDVGPAGDQVLLSVSDTGIGVAPELRDQIFEPFVSTKTGSGDGHGGLGLAIVYGIVDQHGGTIEVESEVGTGTTFSVSLPRCVDEAAVAVGEEDADLPVHGTEKILLVDDNDDFRESTGALLAEYGYQVTAAADGEAALDRCAEQDYRFDLVLTDVVMPGIGGRELVDRIRRQRHVKVIFMSGHSERMLSRCGVERGEVQVLKNLVAGKALARSIRRLLDGDPSA